MKRHPNAGKKKGQPNKKSKDIKDMLDSMGFNPIMAMAKAAMDEVPCRYCDFGEGPTGLVEAVKRAKYLGIRINKDMQDKLDHEKCPACDGTKMERVDLKLRLDMASKVAEYYAPKRRAVEHIGDDANPIRHEISLGEASQKLAILIEREVNKGKTKARIKDVTPKPKQLSPDQALNNLLDDKEPEVIEIATHTPPEKPE